MRKKFLIKVFFLALAISSIPLSAIYFDTFNIFHWKNIRFTKADPNKNYIKTQYIVHNPKKFNAFVFGSSRVGAIPKDALPLAAPILRSSVAFRRRLIAIFLRSRLATLDFGSAL